MKNIVNVVIFLLLSAAMGGGFYFFREAQNNAGRLVKAEQRLNEVKRAFEERARLLDALKKSFDNAEKLSRQMEGKLNKAKLELGSNQAVESKMAELIADRNTLDDQLIENQNLLEASREAAKSNMLQTQKRFEEMQRQLADSKLMDEQLKQANKNIERLNKGISATEAELKSQKQLLKDKLKIVEEFERLGLSPDEIRTLRDENTQLKAVVPTYANSTVSNTIQKETSRWTLKTLPLDLKVPSADKRLTKPLKADNIFKPIQP